jgi:hypothetical protein
VNYVGSIDRAVWRIDCDRNKHRLFVVGFDWQKDIRFDGLGSHALGYLIELKLFGAAPLHYAIAASAKSALNSYMAREPNVPSDIQSALFAKSTLKRPDRPDRDEPARPKGQTRPIEARYLLRVDGQIKRSFSSKEPAVIAGAEIRKAYPVVVVTVVDTQEHTTEIINA